MAWSGEVMAAPSLPERATAVAVCGEAAVVATASGRLYRVEAEQGRSLAEALVKRLTGGDKLSARFLYGEYFEFLPSFKLWLGVNHKPNIRGTDEAIWRRIRVIPFAVTVPAS